MKSLSKNKKGVLGLETVKVVIITMLTLAVLVIAMFVVLLPLRTAVENIDTQTSSVINDSTQSVVTEVPAKLSVWYYRNPSCTVTQCVNASNGKVISSPNYTANTDCTITYISADLEYNRSIWKCNVNVVYDNNGTNQIVDTMINSPIKFFNQTPTFFILLGIVVLILIISVVIVAVTRFQSPELGSFGGGSGENSYTGGLANI